MSSGEGEGRSVGAARVICEWGRAERPGGRPQVSAGPPVAVVRSTASRASATVAGGGRLSPAATGPPRTRGAGLSSRASPGRTACRVTPGERTGPRAGKLSPDVVGGFMRAGGRGGRRRGGLAGDGARSGRATRRRTVEHRRGGREDDEATAGRAERQLTDCLRGGRGDDEATAGRRRRGCGRRARASTPAPLRPAGPARSRAGSVRPAGGARRPSRRPGPARPRRPPSVWPAGRRSSPSRRRPRGPPAGGP